MASTRRPVRPHQNECRECGRAFLPTDVQQEFCCPTCRQAWRSRALTRGAKLYEAVMTWRVLRQPGGFAAVTALVSKFLEQDRSAGRRWRPRTFNPNTGRRSRPAK
ncbi:hypothetical protein ACIU1J_01790 [Azospirillum doebereinerae]|uniref:hypothetical protein n=1 Tax=Azospirillum doebereinerae TaxID=92933 RepID=UPI001EE5E4D1|nr:hypothetical protein [Azospirillum doebereinerae]MCG5240063.1 hypothetical protein [Azospirillum doebereinerae]